MRILIELPLTIALFTLAVKYGWPYTVIFVLGYILAFAFKLPYLSKRTQVSTRFLIFLAIFLAFALTASAIITRFLFSENGQAWIAAGRIKTFLLVTPALKVSWAAIAGFGLTALGAAIILIPYGMVAGQQMYSQYEQYKGHEGDAAKTAIGAMLGISRGTWIVSDGKAEVKGDPSGALARFGGPGVLIVQEGHAVILEMSGKISRVVGRGITWLKPFERISMVVPLQTRQEKITVEQVATRDKIIIEEFDILVFHKVDPGRRRNESQMAYLPTTKRSCARTFGVRVGVIRVAAYRSVAETATRDVVGRFTLEEIFPISDDFRAEFRRVLTEQINKVTQPLMGVVVGTVDINRVKIPEEAKGRLLKMWLATRDVQIAESEKLTSLTQGEAEMARLRLKEVTRAEAQTRMMAAITEGIRQVREYGGDPQELIAMRFIEALEKMTEDPATKVFLPNNISEMLEQFGRPMAEP